MYVLKVDEWLGRVEVLTVEPLMRVEKRLVYAMNSAAGVLIPSALHVLGLIV